MKFKSKNKTWNTTKNSTGVQSTQLLKILQKMLTTKEGSVSYIFESDRVANIHANDLKDMKEYKAESRLHVNLNPQVFTEETSPNDLVNLFETTMLDLGAKRYILS